MFQKIQMADESRDIKTLIKLQKQRPAFSRIISWEMGQTAQYQPVKKEKRKKKKVIMVIISYTQFVSQIWQTDSNTSPT